MDFTVYGALVILVLFQFVQCNHQNASVFGILDSPVLRTNGLQLVVPKDVKMNDINDYQEILLPAYSNTHIQLRKMAKNGKDVGFALIQLNSYEYNVTLSYTNTFINGAYLTGTNLGLVMYEDGSLYAINMNPYEDVMVSLILLLYNKTAPIPGGCNMEFPVEMSPVLNLTVHNSIIEVDTPQASIAKIFNTSNNACGKASLIYETYYSSMPLHDFSDKTYFSYIRQLISYAGAKSSGHINKLTSNPPSVKRFYDRQVGRGMVFVTAVIDPVNRGYSVYAPVQTYACQPFLDIVDCYEFNVPAKIVGFIVIVAMVVECVFWIVPIFTTAIAGGAVLGALVTMTILKSKHSMLTENEVLAALIVGAVACAVLFLVISLIWPLAALVGCSMVVSYIVFNIIFYGIYGVLVDHWLISLTFVLVSGILMVPCSWYPAFIVVNSVMFCAFVLFLGVNQFFGAQLHSWFRSEYRSLINPNYGTSVLADTSLDTNDILAIVVFLFILSVCLVIRVRFVTQNNRNHRAIIQTNCWTRTPSGSQALLVDDSYAQEDTSNHPTITRWTSGDDDVFESPESNSRFFERVRNFRSQ